MPKFKNLETIPTTKNDKCSSCVGSKCCQYITEPLDTPRSIKDFDTLLWQVSHINTHCFKDSQGWFLLSYGSCEHLSENGQCKIYHQRPFICREHSDNDCEYDQPIEAGAELYFRNYKEIDEYCRKRFKSWDKRFD